MSELRYRTASSPCANDQIAFGLIRTLSERGPDVPDDIGVFGVDDEILAEYWTPALTTYRLDFERAGAAALRALLADDLESPIPPPGTFRMKVRESSAPPCPRPR